MTTKIFSTSDFLDLNYTKHDHLFEAHDPWTALEKIAEVFASSQWNPGIDPAAMVSPHARIGPEVRIEEGTMVEAGAVILGPAWIGKSCTVRTGAYLRQNVLVGDHCMLGNSCEFKHCLLFDHCEVPHFNYVGDAILGFKAHLGAGAILSNVRLDREEVRIRHGNEVISTGLKKFSAILGDRAEVGCNSVINPGSLIGRDSILYPGCIWSGVLASGKIVKVRQSTQIEDRRSSQTQR